MKMLLAAAVIAGASTFAAVSSLAMTQTPAPHLPGATPIIKVIGGCGPNGHRGPYGHCRPRYSCPRGWHPGPYGWHCFPNR